jgi:hypothetical protein
MTGWTLVGFIAACWVSVLAALVLGLVLCARWFRKHPYNARPMFPAPPARPRARHLASVNKNAACGVGAPRRQTAKGQSRDDRTR